MKSDDDLMDKLYDRYVRPLSSDENPWQISRAYEKMHNAFNLEKAARRDDGGWIKHTDTYWSRTVDGKRVEFWPTKKKYRVDGKTHYGSVYKIIPPLEYEDTEYFKRKAKQAEDLEANLVNQPEI